MKLNKVKNLLILNNFKQKLALLKKKPIFKNQIKGLKKKAGRNNSGKITINHKGSGHKKSWRNINFNLIKSSTGIICNIEYDPNRNCFISLIYCLDNKNFYYQIAPKKIFIGDIIKTNSKIEPKLGHSLPLSKISIGSYLHNISIKNFNHAQIARSAGTFGVLKEITDDFAFIELNSGQLKKFHIKSHATLGIVSNDLVFLSKLKKAGQNRWLNKRPSVRGVAMNPIDHPNGGGEGKKSGKKKSPWGKPKKSFKNG